MTPLRTGERTKSLRIEPISEDLVRFVATLVDQSYASDGTDIIHSLSIEGTISVPDLTIRSIEPKAIKQPYTECAASLDPVRRLVGMRIRRGFSNQVRDALGGIAGCTHFLTLVLDLGAAHTLTTFLRIRGKVLPGETDRGNPAWTRVALSVEPRLENACIALRSESPVIRRAKTSKDA